MSNTISISELKGHEYDLEFEKYLLSNKDLLSWMNNLLQQNEFTEDFLIKTRQYYDSWKCLRNQSNLSIYFCFRYLYDSSDDSADDWTDYNQIEDYLKTRGYDDPTIKEAFKIAMENRKKEKKF